MDRLSPRERAIVDLRCRRGYTVREAATALGIGYQTAKTHAAATYRKLAVPTAEQMCFRFGQHDPAPPGLAGLAAMRAREV